MLEVGENGLPFDVAVKRCGRLAQDLSACIHPMVSWKIIEPLEDGRNIRFRSDMAESLRNTIERVVEERADHLDRERRVMTQLLGGMIGLDPKMQLVFELIRQVARLDVPVLIQGETGTGKELVARAIHDLSGRDRKFFGAINCATLVDNLFESQIFGHARGAFTGATRNQIGLIQRCDGGTLFLDELGELSGTNQVKLLRVLQERSFTPLGETTPRDSDFRLVTATNRELSTMVSEKSFREDLFYRINVFPIRIPSLRERMSDLPYLVEGIIAAQGDQLASSGETVTITQAGLAHMEHHSWPGNVRELENVIIRAAIVSGGQPISVEHLPAWKPANRPEPNLEGQLVPILPALDLVPGPAGTGSLADVERLHIGRVLQASGGNICKAASILQISRTTLYRRMRVYGLDTRRSNRLEALTRSSDTTTSA
jgi:DNA-binding NtrC family response regulator